AVNSAQPRQNEIISHSISFHIGFPIYLPSLSSYKSAVTPPGDFVLSDPIGLFHFIRTIGAENSYVIGRRAERHGS
ncbi:hypothetical protein, partial [Pseudomonas poae]|uniref:hypothetical protein n=1 Tax=Pseudomonas poae TaxID=200451 RepID=UPI0034D6E0E3